MANQRSDGLSDQQLEGISGGTGSPILKGATGTVGNSGISSSTAGSESTINSSLNPNLSDVSGNPSGSMGDLQSTLHQAGIDTSPPLTSEIPTSATSGTQGSHSEGSGQSLAQSEISAALLAKELQQAQVEQQQLPQVQQLLLLQKEMQALQQMEKQVAAGNNFVPGGKIAEELMLQDEMAILLQKSLGPK
jgi:hypothetical protein